MSREIIADLIAGATFVAAYFATVLLLGRVVEVLL